MKVDPLERSKWSARGAGGSVLLGSGSEFAPRPGQQKCNESEKKQRPDYLKQIQNCRSQQHKWCVRQVSVGVFVCVWCGCSWQQRVMCCQPVDDVADAATASGARQAAAEREETVWKWKKVAGGRRLGARESAHWLLTLDEPRWSTIFKRYVNIWQVVIVVVIVHCLFSTSFSLFSFSSFPFFCWCFLLIFF